jgi:hypothetical protein
LRAPKSKIQFSGVGGLLTYISFTQGADDMTFHEEWISYSQWGNVPDWNEIFEITLCERSDNWGAPRVPNVVGVSYQWKN